MKKVIATVEAPKAVGPYSQAIAVGSMLFCAGQIPLSPQTGELIDGDASAQAERVLENLGAVLRANGMTYAHVVKTTVFLIDLGDFAAMNEAYAAAFSSPYPARTTVYVTLPAGMLIEADVVAVASS